VTDEPAVPLRAIAELLDHAAIPYMVVDYIERWVDALGLRLQWDRARRLTQ